MQDFLGQDLVVSDIVIASQGHELACYKIMHFSPKMVRVKKLTNKHNPRDKGKLRYPYELYKIPEELATFYLLKLK